MDGIALQDKISRGMGRAARKLGSPFIVYRPNGPANPTSTRNRIIKLYASFNARDPTYSKNASYGQPTWWGVYDASYTQPGDYLVGTAQTFFVSSQRPALPVQCVLTNRSINLLRSPETYTGGYAGIVEHSCLPLLTDWPASLLATTSKTEGNALTSKFGQWMLLLPQLPIDPAAGDVIVDDLERRFVVGAAEISDLGWRLNMRQIAA